LAALRFLVRPFWNLSHSKTCGKVRDCKGVGVQKVLPHLRIDVLNNACNSGTEGDEAMEEIV